MVSNRRRRLIRAASQLLPAKRRVLEHKNRREKLAKIQRAITMLGHEDHTSITHVSAVAHSKVLLPARSSRRSLVIENNASSPLLLSGRMTRLATLQPGEAFELAHYTGELYGQWDSNSGGARVVEYFR